MPGLPSGKPPAETDAAPDPPPARPRRRAASAVRSTPAPDRLDRADGVAADPARLWRAAGLPASVPVSAAGAPADAGRSPAAGPPPRDRRLGAAAGAAARLSLSDARTGLAALSVAGRADL